MLAAQPQSTDENAKALSYSQCLVALDSAVALATNETRRNLAAVNAAGSIADTIDRQAVDSGLAELETRCPPLPQLAHNRGVLAASAERWPEAIAHLERSLLQDPRAAQTYQLLQGIYEFQASQAYAKALDTPVKASKPALEWQDSTRLNAEARLRSEGVTPYTSDRLLSLKTVSTLEYELSSWWQALHANRDAKLFYIDGYSTISIDRSRQSHANRPWQEIQREITFTANDAVAVIKEADSRSTLLLLRLIGTRWKIYQETPL